MRCKPYPVFVAAAGSITVPRVLYKGQGPQPAPCSVLCWSYCNTHWPLSSSRTSPPSLARFFFFPRNSREIPAGKLMFLDKKKTTKAKKTRVRRREREREGPQGAVGSPRTAQWFGTSPSPSGTCRVSRFHTFGSGRTSRPWSLRVCFGFSSEGEGGNREREREREREE